MENKDAILIRKYLTLMESIDNKVESKTEEPIDEQVGMFKDLIKTLGRTVETEKALWQTLKTEIPTIGGRFKSAAEFKAAAEAGKITAAESSEIVKYAIKNVPEVAIKMKGLLRGQPEFAEIAKQVFPKGTQMAADPRKLELAKKTMAQFGIEGKEAEAMLKKAAQDAGGSTKVTAKAVDKAVAKRAGDTTKKATGAGKDAAKTAEEASKITKGKEVMVFGGGKKYHEWLKKMWEKFGKRKTVIEDGIKKVTVTKKLLQWALLAGGAYFIYSLLTDSDGSDVIVTDEGGNVVDPNLIDGMAECLRKLIDEGSAEIEESSDGSPIVYVKNTGNSEYDSLGGLNFYMNGRVISDDASKRGNWKCKQGKIQTIPESFVINEQGDSDIANDVETMIELLDFPVSGDDLVKANALLSKYAKSSRGKDFLELYDKSGLADASLETSLDYIATFKASSVQAKNNMYKLIKQIESGKTGGGEDGGNKTASLSDIEITWDGDKPVPVPPIPVPEPEPRPKYVNCESFPFRFGCKNPKIKEVQRCLGMEVEYQTGNFGPLTLRVMRNKFGMDVIDEITYNGIISKCKGGTPNPSTGNTVTNTGSTITPPKPVEPVKPTDPTQVEPAKVASATKTTQLNREGCKTLFKTIDERDQSQGVATASKAEREQLKFCMQQYNFGVGTGVNKMKRRYGLTASGGDRGIK